MGPAVGLAEFRSYWYDSSLLHSNFQSWQMRSLPTLDRYRIFDRKEFEFRNLQIDKGVLKKWSTKQPCPDCRLIVNCTDKKDCRYLFNLPYLSDEAIGGILACLSLVALCVSLFFLVKILNSLLKGSVAEAVKRVVNPKFKNPFLAYFFGVLLIFIGAVGTIAVQSSSVFTSTLTPMVGLGYIEIETCYPMFLGSNIGTTCTSMLAALTQSGTDNFKNTIQGALVHLFFNIIGILLFYPIPFMR